MIVKVKIMLNFNFLYTLLFLLLIYYLNKKSQYVNENIHEIKYNSKTLEVSDCDTVIVVPIFNRKKYLESCLQSLDKCFLNNSIVVFVDDSSDFETQEYLKNVSLSNISFIKIFKKVNRNMFDSFRMVFDEFYKYENIKFFVTLDSDTIHKPEWLIKLKLLYYDKENEKKNGNMLLTGFNTLNHLNISEHQNCYKKNSCGGINMFFDKNLYPVFKETLYDALWDWRVVQLCQINNWDILCTKPSVINHIGFEGLSYGKQFDVAFDF